MKIFRSYIEKVYFSLPIRLLINHIKNNQILLLFWICLFAMIYGKIGKFLGIQYLFLDPEYLNEVNFFSFMLIGVSLAGFTTAFHITSYIIDSHRFSFIGKIPSPFTTFSLNNSIVPTFFLGTYIYLIIDYKLLYAGAGTTSQIILGITGLVSGFLLIGVILYTYFLLTNKDIFKYVICKVDEKLKKKVPATRANAMNKLQTAKAKQITVKSYFNFKLRPTRIFDDKGFYDRETVLQVFDQNHFNLVIIELFIFTLLLLIGVFREYAIFQIPAAASLMLLFTFLVMIAGAFSYWFGRWSTTVAVALFIIVNIIAKEDFLSKEYKAYGLDYNTERVQYNLETIKQLNSADIYNQDKASTLKILQNWKANHTEVIKPKMVLTCVSGGGQRAALWALTALQSADSISEGELMKHTMLITGASGGMIGAAYFRELILRSRNDSSLNSPYHSSHQYNIAKDNLNSIIFSLLVNDFFIGGLNSDDLTSDYQKDRGYAFEKQLEMNTGGLLKKPIIAYKEPEEKAQIPMLIMAPTIMNDGRKMFISPQNVSYMAADPEYGNWSGVDFLRLFKEQGSDKLTFYSALRMNAAFPYITPNVSLPSKPALEIMDAGIADNFGINDAVRFLYIFKEWISENTSGVIILSIRDSKKEFPISDKEGTSIIEKFTTPISSIYSNFENLQNVNNDSQIQHARSWFKGELKHLVIEYNPQLNANITDRASLNWRLTENEKQSLLENINSSVNQEKINTLKETLNN